MSPKGDNVVPFQLCRPIGVDIERSFVNSGDHLTQRRLDLGWDTEKTGTEGRVL